MANRNNNFLNSGGLPDRDRNVSIQTIINDDANSDELLSALKGVFSGVVRDFDRIGSNQAAMIGKVIEQYNKSLKSEQKTTQVLNQFCSQLPSIFAAQTRQAQLFESSAKELSAVRKDLDTQKKTLADNLTSVTSEIANLNSKLNSGNNSATDEANIKQALKQYTQQQADLLAQQESIANAIKNSYQMYTKSSEDLVRSLTAAGSTASGQKFNSYVSNGIRLADRDQSMLQINAERKKQLQQLNDINSTIESINNLQASINNPSAGANISSLTAELTELQDSLVGQQQAYDDAQRNLEYATNIWRETAAIAGQDVLDSTLSYTTQQYQEQTRQAQQNKAFVDAHEQVIQQMGYYADRANELANRLNSPDLSDEERANLEFERENAEMMRDNLNTQATSIEQARIENEQANNKSLNTVKDVGNRIGKSFLNLATKGFDYFYSDLTSAISSVSSAIESSYTNVTASLRLNEAGFKDQITWFESSIANMGLSEELSSTDFMTSMEKAVGMGYYGENAKQMALLDTINSIVAPGVDIMSTGVQDIFMDVKESAIAQGLSEEQAMNEAIQAVQSFTGAAALAADTIGDAQFIANGNITTLASQFATLGKSVGMTGKQYDEMFKYGMFSSAALEKAGLNSTTLIGTFSDVLNGTLTGELNPLLGSINTSYGNLLMSDTIKKALGEEGGLKTLTSELVNGMTDQIYDKNGNVGEQSLDYLGALNEIFGIGWDPSELRADNVQKLLTDFENRMEEYLSSATDTGSEAYQKYLSNASAGDYTTKSREVQKSMENGVTDGVLSVMDDYHGYDFMQDSLSTGREILSAIGDGTVAIVSAMLGGQGLGSIIGGGRGLGGGGGLGNALSGGSSSALAGAATGVALGAEIVTAVQIIGNTMSDLSSGAGVDWSESGGVFRGTLLQGFAELGYNIGNASSINTTKAINNMNDNLTDVWQTSVVELGDDLQAQANRLTDALASGSDSEVYELLKSYGYSTEELREMSSSDRAELAAAEATKQEQRANALEYMETSGMDSIQQAADNQIYHEQHKNDWFVDHEAINDTYATTRKQDIDAVAKTVFNTMINSPGVDLVSVMDDYAEILQTSGFTNAEITQITSSVADYDHLHEDRKKSYLQADSIFQERWKAAVALYESDPSKYISPTAAYYEANQSECDDRLRAEDVQVVYDAKGDAHIYSPGAQEYWNNGMVTSDSFYYGGGEYAAPYATGLERVPYDRFPALLHEGERVLTSGESQLLDALMSSIGTSSNTGNDTNPYSATIVSILESMLNIMRTSQASSNTLPTGSITKDKPKQYTTFTSNLSANVRASHYIN